MAKRRNLSPFQARLGLAAVCVLALGLFGNLALIGVDFFSHPTGRMAFAFACLCALAVVATVLLWRLYRILAASSARSPGSGRDVDSG